MPEKQTHPISDVMDMVTGRGGNEKASWPVMLVLIIVVVIVLAIVGVKMALAKRKAAELAFKIRKAEEKKKQAEEDSKLRQNSEDKQAAWEEVRTLSKEVLSLKAQMAVRSEKHKKHIADLEAVTSWDEIEVTK
jgi:uncharacterized protein YxeA